MTFSFSRRNTRTTGISPTDPRPHALDRPPAKDAAEEERIAQIARNILMGLTDDFRKGGAPTEEEFRLLSIEAGRLSENDIAPLADTLALTTAAANLSAAPEVDSSHETVRQIKMLAHRALDLTLPSDDAQVYKHAIELTAPGLPLPSAYEIASDDISNTKNRQERLGIAHDTTTTGAIPPDFS